MTSAAGILFVLLGIFALAGAVGYWLPIHIGDSDSHFHGGNYMLVLTMDRKKNSQIAIEHEGELLIIELDRVGQHQARVAFDGPRSFRIVRANRGRGPNAKAREEESVASV